MLYEPTRFDALIDEPWVPARVEDAMPRSIWRHSARRARSHSTLTPPSVSAAKGWLVSSVSCHAVPVRPLLVVASTRARTSGESSEAR